MPFFGKKTKPDDGASRKRLEYQLHLAKHGPDNIVDLSNCELKQIPSGTYAICKVLLKEVLLLHSNRLKDLKEDGAYDDLLKNIYVRILDIHNNQLIELPTNIDRLTSLQVLNLQQNKLRILPSALCRLTALQTLNLKENELHQLPDNIGDLSCLRTLDISDNKIDTLPNSLGRARCLETLIVDWERMIYPAADTCAAGTEEMMKFLCQKSSIEYLPPSHGVLSLMNKPESNNKFQELQLPSSLIYTNGSISSSNNVLRTRSLGAKPDNFEVLASRAISYEQIKDQRRKELMRLEGELTDVNKKQLELLDLMNTHRRDLLKMMAKEQTDTETKFHNLQERRDGDRKRFLIYLTKMEEHTKTLISRLLDMNAKAKKTENMLEQEERARQFEQGLFKVKMDEYEQLRKKEVERAMEMNVCQYFSLEQLRAMQESRRDQIASQAKFEDTITNENLTLVLHTRDCQMNQLLQRLIVEEAFQKEALLALMEQHDARSNRLNRQIELIQFELTHLSILEIRNREEKEIDVMTRLREQREALCAMMMQLLEEKAQRSKELQKRLIEMEKERLQDQVDFWLIHYQRLLDTKPDALLDAERELDMCIIKILNVSNAQDYVPAFARHHVTPETIIDLTEEDLQRMGMYQVGLRKNVLQAIEGLKAEKKLYTKPPRAPAVPLAASLSAPVPTAPMSPVVLARYEMECVICMTEDCGLVFLPCGHVCSCRSCGEKVTDCPLCRAHIEQRIDLCAGSACA